MIQNQGLMVRKTAINIDQTEQIIFYLPIELLNLCLPPIYQQVCVVLVFVERVQHMLSIRIELQLRLGSRTIILNLKKPPRGAFCFPPRRVVSVFAFAGAMRRRC